MLYKVHERYSYKRENFGLMHKKCLTLEFDCDMMILLGGHFDRLRVSKKPPTVKIGYLTGERHPEQRQSRRRGIYAPKRIKISLLRKVFWLTSQLGPYRTFVRLQVRVVCLGGPFDLRQSVKKTSFLTDWHAGRISACVFYFILKSHGIFWRGMVW